MFTGTFSTQPLRSNEQLEAWRGWYGPVFEAASLASSDEGFAATNDNWTVGGFTLSRVTSPPNSVARTPTFMRRNPVDHWVITLSKQSESQIKAPDIERDVPPGVPFILSLGQEMFIGRKKWEERVQLLMSRDCFGAIAPMLDAANGVVLDSPQGKLLADYMMLLETNLSNLAAEDASRLPDAVQAMVEVCVAPSADRLVKARSQINLTLMERVRRAVGKHLRSHTLGPDKLCREAATSRSQLYRLLESEGGVVAYIQRRRLSESFATLCDVSNNSSIGTIAEMLCFADASSFTRAFRREFGMSPKEVRAASLGGLSPAMPKAASAHGVRTFGDCLRSF
jgi:AraC-like DNA-binding protein